MPALVRRRGIRAGNSTPPLSYHPLWRCVRREQVPPAASVREQPLLPPTPCGPRHETRADPASSRTKLNPPTASAVLGLGGIWWTAGQHTPDETRNAPAPRDARQLTQDCTRRDPYAECETVDPRQIGRETHTRNAQESMLRLDLGKAGDRGGLGTAGLDLGKDGTQRKTANCFSRSGHGPRGRRRRRRKSVTLGTKISQPA